VPTDGNNHELKVEGPLEQTVKQKKLEPSLDLQLAAIPGCQRLKVGWCEDKTIMPQRHYRITGIQHQPLGEGPPA